MYLQINMTSERQSRRKQKLYRCLLQKESNIKITEFILSLENELGVMLVVGVVKMCDAESPQSISLKQYFLSKKTFTEVLCG